MPMVLLVPIHNIVCTWIFSVWWAATYLCHGLHKLATKSKLPQPLSKHALYWYATSHSHLASHCLRLAPWRCLSPAPPSAACGCAPCCCRRQPGRRLSPDAPATIACGRAPWWSCHYRTSQWPNDRRWGRLHVPWPWMGGRGWRRRLGSGWCSRRRMATGGGGAAPASLTCLPAAAAQMRRKWGKWKLGLGSAQLDLLYLLRLSLDYSRPWAGL